jgi:hypothetical protein
VNTVAKGSLACALARAAAGCGFKGQLTMPEKSTSVVIRGPQGSAPTTAPTPSAPAPATPAEGAAQPTEDTMPPPPLPGSNPGSRGD